MSRTGTGMSRTGTGMPRISDKFLSYTGVGYTTTRFTRMGTKRVAAKRPQETHALAIAAKERQQGPFPLIQDTNESVEGLQARLEQMRMDAVLRRGDGLPGKIWQTKTHNWSILPHLLQDPEYPQDDLLPIYAKLFAAAVGVPVRHASDPQKLQVWHPSDRPPLVAVADQSRGQRVHINQSMAQPSNLNP
jgi:hypothetical protein